MGCLWGQQVSAKLLDMAYFTLDNGLNVAVIENHKAPIALQMLYYKTGSANDAKGKGGLAHLLEHMMFRGTKNLPDKTFNRLTEEHGASNNAYTTYQETCYYEFTDVAKLELMMALEAERMQNLVIDDDAFTTERDVVLQERMQRHESNPAVRFYEILYKTLWQEHPLASLPSGTAEEIAGLTVDDARVFYQRYYRPDNALLVLVGDIDKKEAEILVKKYYGALRTEGKPDKAPIPPAREIDSALTVRLTGVQQPRFEKYLRLDGGQFDNKEILALELLVEYLAGDDTSFLYDTLVYQDKKLLSVGMSVSYDNVLGGTLSFYAVPATEPSDLNEMNSLLEAAAVEGIKAFNEEKLERIKNQLLSGAVYLLENPQSAAQFAGGMLMSGYSPEEVMTYDDIIAAVSLDDVLAAWRKAWKVPSRVAGYLEGKAE